MVTNTETVPFPVNIDDSIRAKFKIISEAYIVSTKDKLLLTKSKYSNFSKALAEKTAPARLDMANVNKNTTVVNIILDIKAILTLFIMLIGLDK